MKADIEIANCPVCNCEHFTPVRRVSDTRHGLVKDRLIACCNNCSTTYLRERVPLQQIASYYPSDYISYQFKLIEHPKTFKDKVFNDAIWQQQARRVQILESFLERNKQFAKHDFERLSLLDVGCGTGLFLSEVKKRWNCRVKGCDFSEENVNYARIQLGLDVELKSAEELAEQSETYDIVTMNYYLEHEYHPKKVLKAANRSLKEGGLLLLFELPHIKSLTSRLFGKYWYDYDCPRHTIFFTKDTLGQLLNETGFTIEHFSFSYHPITWSGSLQTLTGWDLWGKGGFYKNLFVHGVLYYLCFPLSIGSALLGLGDEIIVIAKKATNASMVGNDESGRQRP